MKTLLNLRALLVALGICALSVQAQEAFKIGLILPMTGQQATTGKQIEAAARLYMAQNGNTVAGRKIELIIKDDGGIPDAAKRIAQLSEDTEDFRLYPTLEARPEAPTTIFSLTVP